MVCGVQMRVVCNLITGTLRGPENENYITTIITTSYYFYCFYHYYYFYYYYHYYHIIIIIIQMRGVCHLITGAV